LLPLGFEEAGSEHLGRSLFFKEMSKYEYVALKSLMNLTRYKRGSGVMNDLSISHIPSCISALRVVTPNADPLILRGLPFVGAPWVCAQSRSDTASQRVFLG
jgi:hypothetical protein